MNVWKELGALPGTLKDPRQVSRLNSVLVYVLLIVGSLFTSYLIMERTGSHLFLMALLGIFFGTLYTVISFGNLMVPYLLFMLIVGGFKYLWSIRAPMLPDLYLDRMALVWLAVVFFVKFFAEKRRLRGPYLLDVLMFTLALYILIDIFIHGMFPFNSWTMSYVVPFSAFFFAKNLVTTKARIHRLLLLLLGLTIYYSITSIAEKMGFQWLIWPKYITAIAQFEGRSNGPFGHAPLFGTVLGMLLPVHFYFITISKVRLVKWLLSLSLLMAFAGLYFTYTRGAWLAGIMALIAAVLLNPRHFLKIMMPALVVAPILAIGFLGIGQDKFMKERVENEDTIGSRLGTLVTALKVWRDHPIFGVGFYNYRLELDDYIEPVELPIIGTIQVAHFRHNPPHDIYIGFLSETGLVGVFLQGSIYFLILRTFIAKFKWRKKGSYFAIYIMPIFGGIFVGYIVGGLAIDYKFFSIVGALFYSCAGIMYGYQHEESEASDVVLRGNPGDNALNHSLPGMLRQPTSQAD
ncbi:MAG: O-antigen ligase family protein [Candidatus Krumholzibacteriota bacterium]